MKAFFWKVFLWDVFNQIGANVVLSFSWILRILNKYDNFKSKGWLIIKKKLTLTLNDALIVKLKIYALEHQISVSRLIETQMSNYLKDHADEK